MKRNCAVSELAQQFRCEVKPSGRSRNRTRGASKHRLITFSVQSVLLFRLSVNVGWKRHSPQPFKPRLQLPFLSETKVPHGSRRAVKNLSLKISLLKNQPVSLLRSPSRPQKGLPDIRAAPTQQENFQPGSRRLSSAIEAGLERHEYHWQPISLRGAGSEVGPEIARAPASPTVG